METNQGNWWIFALGSAVFAALTTIFAKIGLQNVNSDLATAIRTIVIVVFAWGIVIARGQTGGLAQLNSQTILFLVLSGVATGASWLLYFHALQLGNASLVAGVDKLSLVLIVIFSVFVLGEPLTWKVVVGAGMITIGTLVLIR